MTDAMAPRGPDGCGRLGARRRRPRPPPAVDHRPLRARRAADGRLRARAGGRLQRLHLQLPRAARELEGARLPLLLRPRDTEVILKAYHRWGDGCVERFHGMFAFAIVERDSGRLVLGARPPRHQAALPGRGTGPAALRLDPARAAGRRRRRHRDRPRGPAPLHEASTRSCPRRARSSPASASCRRPPCARSSPTASAAAPSTGTRASPAPGARRLDAADWQDAMLDGAAHRRRAADGRRRPRRRAALRRPRLQPDRRPARRGRARAGLTTFSIGFEAAAGESGDEFELLRPGGRALRHRPPPDPRRRPTGCSRRVHGAVGRDERADGQPRLRRLLPALRGGLAARQGRAVRAGRRRGARRLRLVPAAGRGADGEDAVEAYARVFFDRATTRSSRPSLAPEWLLDEDASRQFVAEHFARAGRRRPRGRGAAPRHRR